MKKSGVTPILCGAAVAAVLSGAGLVGAAGFLPVRPAVPEPPGWLGATWVMLPGLLLIIGGLAISAARAVEPRTAGARSWCGVLAVLAIGAAVWSVSYATAALRGGLPVLAPPLFAIGFVGVLVGAAILAVTGPAVGVWPESWSDPTPPLSLRRLLLGAAGGAAVVGAAVAVFAVWIAVGSVDASTAKRVDRFAVPAEPRAARWAWEAPAGHGVRDVVTAGAGVVVRIDDGVVALDGRTGEQRWHYRRPGADSVGLAASPSGTWVMANFVSSAEDVEGTRVLAFDATTGEVGFDEVTEGGVFGGVRLDMTDHVLIGSGDEEYEPLVTIRAYDLRTGERRWGYTKPKRCRTCTRFLSAVDRPNRLVP